MNVFTDYLKAPRETSNSRNPQKTQLFNGLRKPTNRAHNITVVGQEQGEIDAHRRDAIKRSIPAAPPAGCFFCDDAEAVRKAAE